MRPILAVSILFAPALAFGGAFTVKGADGVTVTANSYGSGAKGVLLVHDDGGSAKDWEAIAGKLSSNGFHVVTLDLRGHGANGGPPAEADYALMVNDVGAAATWLSGKGAKEVMVVGAGLGGSLALNAASTTPTIAGVAVLTPSLNVKGVKASTGIAGLGPRPLFMAVDESDTIAAKAATLLAGKAEGPKLVKLYPAGGSGVRMLNAVADLEGALLGWLNGSWKTGDGAPQHSLQAGQVSDVETTGTKYEDRNR